MSRHEWPQHGALFLPRLVPNAFPRQLRPVIPILFP